MIRFKESNKRLISGVIALVMMVNLAFMSIVSIAAQGSDQEVKVQPAWFDADKYGVWWATDQADSTGTSWRYTVAKGTDSWKYTMHSDLYDAGFAEANSETTRVDIDTTVTPYLNYKVKASKATELYMVVYAKTAEGEINWDLGKKTIKIADIPAGQFVEGQITLADIAGMGEILADNTVFTMYGPHFKTTNFDAEDTFEFYDYYMTNAETTSSGSEEDTVVEPDWLSEAAANKWYNWDWQYGSNEDNRFSLAFSDAGSMTITPNFDWVTNMTHTGTSYTLDLSKTPYLYYDASSQIATDIKLLVGDSNDGVTVVESFTGDKSGKIKLADVAALQSLITDNTLVVHGVRLDPSAGSIAGKTITLNSFKFASESNTGEENTIVDPGWLSEAEANKWYNWDWQYGQDDANRFSLAFSDAGSVTITPNFDWVTNMTHTGTSYTLDLSKTPYLYYDASSQIATDIKLLVGDSNDGVTVVESFTGDKSGKIKLADVAALQSLITDNTLVVHGLRLDPSAGSIAGKAITLNSFKFVSENYTGETDANAIDTIIYPSWLTGSMSYKWYNWDWQYGSNEDNRFSLAYSDTGAMTITPNFEWVKDMTHPGEKYTLDLSKTPYLYYNISSQATTDVKLLVGDNNDGVTVIDSFTGDKSGKIKLADVAVLQPYITNNTLTLHGIRLNPSDNDVTNKKITINLFDFAPDETTYPSSRPAAPQLSLDKQASKVTVTAPENAQVFYKIGAEGTYAAYTEAFAAAENTTVYAKYFSSEGFWSVEGKLKITSEEKPVLKPGDDVIYPTWLTDSEAGSWYDWDWSTGSGDNPARFSVSFPSNGDVVMQMHGDFEDYKHLGATYTLDLDVTPYLYYDISSEFKTDMRLIVRSGQNDGVVIFNEINGDAKGVLDLRTVEALKNYISEDNTLTVSGFTFRVNLADGGTNGKKITIRQFDFAGSGKEYPASRPTAPSVSLDTESPTKQVEATINAPEGAQRVMYRIGSSGEYVDYTEPLVLKKNVEIYAKYFSADGFWSMEGKKTITNISSGSSSEDVKPVNPDWFAQSNNSCWWSDDKQEGSSGDGRFALSYDEFWKATMTYSWARNVYFNVWDNDHVVSINLNDQNALFYKVKSDFAISVYLQVKRSATDSAEPVRVLVGTIPAGDVGDSISLGDNPELLALSDEDNNLLVQGVRFEFAPADNSSFQVERFVFDNEDAYYEGGEVVVLPMTPDWFDKTHVQDWWNGQIMNGTIPAEGKFEVEVDANNDWTARLLTGMELDSRATPLTIHMKKNNTLYYRIRNTVPVKLSLNVTFNGTQQKITLIESLPAGNNAGYVELNSIEGIEAFGNKLNLAGVSFESTDANTIFVDNFVFDKPGQEYIGYPDENQIKADQEKAAAVDAVISAIGEVTIAKQNAILDARAKYDALTGSQKAYVTKFDVLVAAESKLDQLLMAYTGGVMNKIPTKDIVEYITQNSGKKIIINLNIGDTISSDILKAAKANDCDIVVKIIDPVTQNIDYVFTIYSKDIIDPNIPFNTALITDKDQLSKSIGDKAFKELQEKFASGKNAYFRIDQNSMGVKANIALSLNSDLLKELNGMNKCYIYRLDEATGKIMLVAQDVVAVDGQISFEAAHPGMYIVSTLKLANASIDADTIVHTGAENNSILLVISIALLTSCAGALTLKRRKSMIEK